jgi:hypothetical protein
VDNAPRDAGVSALEDIREAGTALGKAWRLSPQDDARVQVAWEAYRSVLSTFIDASSELLRDT